MSKVRGGQVFVEIGADPRKFFAALAGINKQIGAIGKSMRNFGGSMAAAGVAVAAPLAYSTRTFAQFDDAIRATQAVTQSFGKEGAAAFASMSDKARELGASTSFTAVEVANLMTELGRAGFKPDEINAMTAAVLNLARATGTDATLASGIMAATLRQFELGAEDATRAADVLTKTANATFNTVEGLGEALKYAGPVAKELGLSLEDTAAILGVLGNVGIQGSEAGTALRRLGVISAASGDELKNLFGVMNTDAAGNLKPLVQILDEINTATANMPVAERTKRMAEAFGLLGITSANVLAKAGGGVADLANELRNAKGTAAETAAAMDAGLGGSMRILLSAIEGVQISLGDAFAPALQSVATFATNLSSAIKLLVDNNRELVASFGKGLVAFTAAGGAIALLGFSLQGASFAFGGLLKAASLVVSPIAMSAKLAVQLGGAFAASALNVGMMTLSLGKYLVSAAATVITTAASAAAVALSWATTALTGVLSFVGSAGMGLASYLASCAAAVVGTVTSAAAMAAAWLAPVAPILAIGAAIGGGALLFAKFGGQAKGALAGVGGMAKQAGSAVAGAFNTVVSDAKVVLADLGTTATTTFGGISDALAAGDLAGAGEVLMLGLSASFQRGTMAIMSYVDPFIADLQDAWGSIQTSSLNSMDSMWTWLGQGFTTGFAFLQGVMDNAVNGLMSAWDTLVANIKKGWLYVQSFFDSGINLDREFAAVDNETAARRVKREKERPGVAGRMQQASAANEQAVKDLADRVAGRNTARDQASQERDATNRERSAARAAGLAAAEGGLTAKREQMAAGKAAADLLPAVGKAEDAVDIRDLVAKIAELRSRGASEAILGKLEDAIDERIVDLDKARASAEQDGDLSAKLKDMGKFATASAAEAVGTFSSSLGGMGIGSSIAQKQLDELKGIRGELKKDKEDRVGA